VNPERDDNLLHALNRWASGQQENFLTEAFGHLLRRLQAQEPAFLEALVFRITGGQIQLDHEELAKCEINTQVFGDARNYPDLEIAGPNTQVYVEVKDASPVDENQLSRYARLLAKRSVPDRCVVLLSRHIPPDLSIEGVAPPVRWSQVGAWINELETDDEVTEHVASQFMSFMRSKGLLIEKVEWELVPGVQQLARLQEMGREVLESLEARVGESNGRGYSGLQIWNPENNQMMYVLRTYLADPSKLWFGVVDAYRPQSGIDDWERREGIFAVSLDLPSEEVHFFERSTHSQMDRMKSFVEDCFEAVGFNPAG
jgi:hypothetical protein